MVRLYRPSDRAAVGVVIGQARVANVTAKLAQQLYGTGLTYGTRVLHTRDMNTTQAASHILAIAAELETLPALPVIYARDMYAAQGVRLTAEDRAALKARADFNRKWGLPDTGITLRVLSPSGARIGGMTYRNF